MAYMLKIIYICVNIVLFSNKQTNKQIKTISQHLNPIAKFGSHINY